MMNSDDPLAFAVQTADEIVLDLDVLTILTEPGTTPAVRGWLAARCIEQAVRGWYQCRLAL